jgi:hypothetical protein
MKQSRLNKAIVNARKLFLLIEKSTKDHPKHNDLKKYSVSVLSYLLTENIKTDKISFNIREFNKRGQNDDST